MKNKLKILQQLRDAASYSTKNGEVEFHLLDALIMNELKMNDLVNVKISRARKANDEVMEGK